MWSLPSLFYFLIASLFTLLAFVLRGVSEARVEGEICACVWISWISFVISMFVELESIIFANEGDEELKTVVLLHYYTTSRKKHLLYVLFLLSPYFGWTQDMICLRLGDQQNSLRRGCWSMVRGRACIASRGCIAAFFFMATCLVVFASHDVRAVRSYLDLIPRSVNLVRQVVVIES